MIMFGYALLMSIIILLDRATKIGALQSCAHSCVHVTPFLSFSLAYNRGVAWSLGEKNLWCISILVSMLTLFLCVYAYHQLKKGRTIWPECMIIAGSLSNIYDRYTVGAVIDFIEFSYGTFSFPIFNVADIAIVMGVMIMLLKEYKEAV